MLTKTECRDSLQLPVVSAGSMRPPRPGRSCSDAETRRQPRSREHARLSCIDRHPDTAPQVFVSTCPHPRTYSAPRVRCRADEGASRRTVIHAVVIQSIGAQLCIEQTVTCSLRVWPALPWWVCSAQRCWRRGCLSPPPGARCPCHEKVPGSGRGVGPRWWPSRSPHSSFGVSSGGFGPGR